MAMPSVITDLTVDESTNVPADSETITPTLRPSDYLRAHAAILRRPFAKGADVASATAANLGANTDGDYFHVTGTTGLAASNFGTVAAGIERTIVFDGALLLTHNATSFILPGGANITTAAGDVAVFRSEGSGNWKCTHYQKAAGYQPLDTTLTALASALTAANKIPYATAPDTLGELDLSTNTSLGTSDTTLSSQKAVKTYVDTQVATSVADSEFTGANQFIAANGYQKIPGGLILQWGTAADPGDSTDTSVTFPLAFPTALLSVSVQMNTTEVIASQGGTRVKTSSVTGITYDINVGVAAKGASTWFAVGY